MKQLIRTTILLLALLLPATAAAYDFEEDGIYYYINSNVAIVTFKGPNIYNPDNEYSGSVVIPATVTHNGTTYPVTAIGYKAFYGCQGLTSIVIPNSVSAISIEAFYECTGLTEVTIPNSVSSIGQSAFLKCSGLKTVYYNAENCGSFYSFTLHPFYNCPIDRIVIGDKVRKIPAYFASEFTGLTKITIPNSVTSIGQEAFYGCTGLTSIDIPNSVTAIGDQAFHGCTGLTSIVVESGNPKYDSRDNCNALIETANNKLIVGCNNTTIPNSVTEIGSGAFFDCTRLTSIDIPNSVTEIGSEAFFGCTRLTSIVIPNSVTEIGDEAFHGCAGLTSIDIPNSLTRIRSGVFEYCTGLTGIIIPNSITAIGDEAFIGCTGLTSINIPKSVTAIGDEAFCACFGLTSIVVESSNPRYDSRNDCNALIETANNKLIVGCSNTIIPNSVTEIGDYAFWYSGLTSAVIPNSVKAIGEGAFKSCTELTSIVIPNSVIVIGNLAFMGCTGLTSIDIPNSVTSIGSYAFAQCTGLTDVYCYIADLSKVSFWYVPAFYLEGGDYSGRTLHVLKGMVSTYKTDVKWYPYFSQIVDDLKPEIPFGDVNSDLEVNIADVNAVISIILGDNDSTSLADVNDDGEINIADINAVISIILNGTQN